ncbi:MAG: short-chain fatty acyl-CoA regulator family protein [Parvularculaceae bacterium]
MAKPSAKLYAGPRLRRLRRSLGLTQAEMAADLDISPSYVTLIERNQRPLSADLLLRLAETYDLDLKSFSGGEEETFAQLQEALSDPLFEERGIGREDLRDLLSASPAMGEAFAALYRAYKTAQDGLMEARAAGDAGAPDPLEEAREFIGGERNYFAALDERGEALARALGAPGADVFGALAARIEDKHGLAVRVYPADVMTGAYRRLDRHRRQVSLSEALDHASRTFQLALQLVLLEAGDALDETLAEGAFKSDGGRRLARAALANYAAAAILMPYPRFFSSAEDLGYDVEALARRFAMSFEQICHRLTTLQRPGAEGVPFFFLRVDAAGNVSKRFSGGLFPFARFGGSCPLWNVHETFRTPRKILTQIIELPDGAAYFSIARTVHGGAGGYGAPQAERAVALGCELKHAEKLVYAKDLDLAAAARAPIGVTCRLCPRANCAARAHPPAERRLIVDEHRRLAAPFSFAFD